MQDMTITSTQDTSILVSIKKMLGIEKTYNAFDEELIMHINTVLASLVQMGVGPQESGYEITGDANQWSEFIADNKKLNQVKTYIYLKVKILFDPNASSVLMESMERQAKELEYRLYTECGGY